MGGLFLASCEEFEDENYDFSNTLPQYVELTSGAAIEALPGDTVSVSARIRVAQGQDITVDYSLGGDLSGSGTITIPASELNGSVDVILPSTPDMGTGTLTLTSASNGYSVGRGDEALGLSSTSVDILWAP